MPVDSIITISRKDNIEPFLRFSGDKNPAHYTGDTPKMIFKELGLSCDKQDLIISPGMNTLLHLEDLVAKDEKVARLEVTFDYPLILGNCQEIIRKKEASNAVDLNEYKISFSVKEGFEDRKILTSTVYGGPAGDYISRESLCGLIDEKDKQKNLLLKNVLIDKNTIKDFISSYSQDVKFRMNPSILPACFFPTAMLSLVEELADKYKIYAKQSLQFNYNAVYKKFSIYGKVIYGKKGFYKIQLAALNENNEPIVAGEALAIEREFKKA